MKKFLMVVAVVMLGTQAHAIELSSLFEVPECGVGPHGLDLIGYAEHNGPIFDRVCDKGVPLPGWENGLAMMSTEQDDGAPIIVIVNGRAFDENGVSYEDTFAAINREGEADALDAELDPEIDYE